MLLTFLGTRKSLALVIKCSLSDERRKTTVVIKTVSKNCFLFYDPRIVYSNDFWTSRNPHWGDGEPRGGNDKSRRRKRDRTTILNPLTICKFPKHPDGHDQRYRSPPRPIPVWGRDFLYSKGICLWSPRNGGEESKSFLILIVFLYLSATCKMRKPNSWIGNSQVNDPWTNVNL